MPVCCLPAARCVFALASYLSHPHKRARARAPPSSSVLRLRQVHVLATPADDAAATLALLAEAVGAAEMELPRERVAQFAPPGA